MANWIPTEGEMIAIVAMHNVNSWAEGMERSYKLNLVENGEILVVRGGQSRERIVWVEAEDNVETMKWGGYLSSTGHVVENVAEIFEISDRI